MSSADGQRLFLSHSGADKPFVDALVVKLREAGVPDPWYDTFEIDAATADLSQQLGDGVAAADWFALVLSPASARSHWVSFEVQAALKAGARALVLLHDSPTGFQAYLSNPHLSELLRGGQRKVLDFTRDYERAFTDMLLVTAPEIGKQHDAALTIAQIVEGDDPDVAQRAMTYAALYPERFLPLLLEQLPELRNDRKVRLRVEGALAAIGTPAIEPLLEFVFQQRRPVPGPQIPLPDVDCDEDEDGTRRYVGSAFSAIVRHMILSGGNRVWSAQLGAEYALVALARGDGARRRTILEELQMELGRATSLIASADEALVPSDEFIDVLRIAIETVGLAASAGEVDDFLIHQFATTQLWRSQSGYVKSKLSSHVTECLSRSGSDAALRRLAEMAHDPEIVQIYFKESRSPNPWQGAFARFGVRAVDELLGMRGTVEPEVLPYLYLNLAQIRHPRGARAVLDWVVEREQSDLMATTILLNVASTGLPEACDGLLERYQGGAFDRFRGEFDDRLHGAAVKAARHATNRALAVDVCTRLCADDDLSVRIELARTVPAVGAHQLYDQAIAWLDDDSPGVRAAAAISLSEHRVLKSPDKLLDEIEYAEPHELAPRLGVALSYFGHERAIDPLVDGLRASLLAYDDALHDTYASALERIGSDKAREAHTAWYRRI